MGEAPLVLSTIDFFCVHVKLVLGDEACSLMDKGGMLGGRKGMGGDGRRGWEEGVELWYRGNRMMR